MTPDEARVIVEKHYWSQYAISKIAAAIVSAVSAERRAALTEAAEVCRKEKIYPDAVLPYDEGCEECALSITALRDKP